MLHLYAMQKDPAMECRPAVCPPDRGKEVISIPFCKFREKDYNRYAPRQNKTEAAYEII